MKLLFYILPFLCLAQQPFNLTGEMFRILVEENHSLGIGNACDQNYAEYEVFEDLNMNHNRIEVLKSRIVVYGEIINPGPIVYLCNESILEVVGQTLTVEDNQPSKLKIWPIPAIDEINITGVDIAILQIYDVTGRLLKNYKTFGRLHTINIQDLSPGLYMLIINQTIKQKFLKN